MNKTNIMDLTRQDLAQWLEREKAPAYRAGQIRRWLYQRQAERFDQMTDLGKAFRQALADRFTLNRLALVDVATSVDGSKKLLFQLRDGETIESVLIPEKSHYTLCISSQVGCAQGCRFCMTARSGFIRNLTQGEIVSQVRDAMQSLDATDSRRLTNIVFMGMGEPLANYRQVVDALDTLTDRDSGMGFSHRRITVSTAGLVSKFADFGREARANLAVSLNAADDATRDRLMPINRKYPIDAILSACRQYPLKPGRKITFEYILLKGINDRVQDAKNLAALLHAVRAKVNLIPLNPHEGSPFSRPEESAIRRFQQILTQKHHTAIVRHSKGVDIAAACGQLRARKIAGPGP